MVAYTSIQILPQTRLRLAQLKSGERETYDDVLNKLMMLVPEGDDEGKYTEEFRVSILNARLDLMRGNTISLKEAKKRLGL
jgi:hypothetical protein